MSITRLAALTTFRRFPGFAGLLALLVIAAPTAKEPPQSGAPPPPTFKGGVEYVEVDVVVTNPQGQIVRDLTKNDFHVSEDGKPQAVSTFALVDIPIEKYDSSLDASQPIEPDVITNEHPVEGRVYVLVLDDLHTAPMGVQRTKAAANQFIERLGANDLMAVVHTAGADIANQEFTNSKRRLLAAVEKTSGRGLAPATAVRNENAVATLGAETGDTEDLNRAANAETTLRVLRDVSDWFATVHGRRKAILLMSEGIDYPMTFADQPDQPNRPTDMLLNTAQEATDAAMRSNVSIYGIDPAGLTGIDDIGVEYFFGPGNRAMGTRGFQRELEMQQESLRWLSEQTGGVAVVGRNDLGTAYDQIVSDNSAYYVLAYQPPGTKRDGKFHKITVRVDRPGLSTRARSGYLSPKGKAPATKALDPAGPSRELRDALASPVPVGGLTMRVSLAPFKGAAPSASVLVTEDLRGRDLKLGSPGTLELSYVAVDAAGKVRAGSNDRLQLMALKPDTQAQIEQSGLRVFNRVLLPPGRYAVRIATHDEAGGALGSVAYDLEVPDFYALPFSMSGLVLTSLATGRMVVAKADAQMKDVLPAPPIAERSFPQNDQVWLFAEVYDNAGSIPHTVTIETTLRSAGGAVVYQVDEEHASSEIAGPRGSYRYRARVPLRDLEPGAYVLTVTARARLGREETASRQVPMTVTAAEK
jgi:VWFA-related protein